MNDLKIEYLPIDTLKPYERNAKLHPDEQVEQIKRSITDNGMNDPIGIWGKDNTIVEGHGRWLACKDLGIEQVPVIRLDHMTDAQRREYALIHNQTTMNSGYDLGVLDLELSNLPDFDADFYGFDLDFEQSEISETEYKENPTSALPESKMYLFGMSAFGVDSECFLELEIPQEQADFLLTKYREMPTNEFSAMLLEAVSKCCTM